jgi:ABC-type lipoprotein export system ATPase subunit
MSSPPDRTHELEARDLVKEYPMGRSRLHVLHRCSLEVARGEFAAIMGKSGSGKSTLLHILGALDVPQLGQVFFNGQPVFAEPHVRRHSASIADVFSAAERRRNHLRRTAFGFVFQFYHLLPELNVLENVLMARMISTSTFAWPGARAAARRDALAILERVGLAGRLKHRPNELSGGERQRVAIARALVHKPRVLLADEPTGNLDAEAGANIMDILRGLHREGQTIVMVTHDAQIAQYADRLLKLEEGRLAPAKSAESRPALDAAGRTRPSSAAPR